MKWSRIVAAAIVIGAIAWIGSGVMTKTPVKEPSVADAPPASSLFKVAVMTAKVEPHRRTLVLSGRTEASNRMTTVTRTSGTLVELKIRRGSRVKAGDVIAVLSDEARDAQVTQARALVLQRQEEMKARERLVASGVAPKLTMSSFEAQLKAAEAALELAEAEKSRLNVVAAWDGIVNDVPVVLGQSLAVNAPVAELIALDPLLAVVEVAERKLAGVAIGELAEVRLVTGDKVQGKIRFVAPRASNQTRTFRVEVEVPNADGRIPDGLTTEVAILFAPIEATRVPRSALTFSSAGELGVRIVGEGDKVGFVPVKPVEDQGDSYWVSGIQADARVIVQGQDFVREGQVVDATAPPTTVGKL